MAALFLLTLIARYKIYINLSLTDIETHSAHQESSAIDAAETPAQQSEKGLKQSDEEYRKWIKVPNALRSTSVFAYKITKQNGPFENFLKSLSGGRYKPYNARQQCYKISKMISAIQLTDLKQFQEVEYQQRLQKVMRAYVATHNGNSARTQILAIKTFMNYMEQTLPAAYTCHLTHFSTIHVTLNNWNKCIQKFFKNL